MNILLFFLLIPLSFAEKQPLCEELGPILQKQESELMSKKANGIECSKLVAGDLLKLNNVDLGQLDLVNDFKCQNLSVIETRIAKLQNEATLLQGFEKLKTHIQAQKEAAGSPAPAVAQEGGMNFVDGVITAQSLELMLNTFSSDKKSVLAKLKEVPMDKRNSLPLFMAQLNALCKGKEALPEDTVDACDPKYFKPNEEAVSALNELINRADHTTELHGSWLDSLAIKKKDGTDYSFTGLNKDLQDGLAKIKDGSLTLSREELRVIRNLPDFKSADGLPKPLKLHKYKHAAAEQVGPEQFKFLVQDLKSRQQLEIQSKVSLTWKDFKSLATNLDGGTSTACENAKNSISSSQECAKGLESLVPTLSGSSQSALQAHLRQMLDSLKISNDYYDSLETLTEKCSGLKAPQIMQGKDIPPACLMPLNSDLADLQNQVAALSALRKTIADENQDLIDMRKFASKKFNELNCGLRTEKFFQDCDEDFKTEVSREVEVLSSEAMDIIVLQNKSDEDKDIAPLCDSEKNVTGKDRLCTFLQKPSVVKNDPRPGAPSVVPSSDNGDSRAMKEAFINGLANFANGIVQTLSPPVMAINPYQSVGPYINNVPPSLGISDSIIVSAQARHGYGSYAALGSPLFPRY